MKKIIFVTLLLFINYLGIAQVTMQPLLPQVGLFQKSQLWNILLVNSAEYPLQCYVVLSLQDRQSGAEIMSATSGSFTLDKGSKQLNEAILTPIQYSYFSFSGDKVNDFLPVGSYNACFKLEGAGHISGDLSEVCLPFDVQPLSPPILILPADSSYLKAQPAQFSWQPPAPMTMFQQLHYEFLVAEIYPGQKPEEAVELNAPVYMDLNVPSNFMNYTGAYPAFEQGKWYAWQVVAKDGDNYAAKTPVFDFTIGDQSQNNAGVSRDMYVLMQDGMTGTYPITKGDIHIKYYSYDKDFSSKVLFTTDDGTEITQYKKHIIGGDNYLDFKLGNSFQSGKAYRAVITDLENNKHVLNFNIQ